MQLKCFSLDWAPALQPTSGMTFFDFPPTICVLAHGLSSKPVQSSSIWSGIISHLRSAVTVKRRWVNLKSHNDCFLGSQAVDVVAEHVNGVKGLEGRSHGGTSLCAHFSSEGSI